MEFYVLEFIVMGFRWHRHRTIYKPGLNFCERKTLFFKSHHEKSVPRRQTFRKQIEWNRHWMPLRFLQCNFYGQLQSIYRKTPADWVRWTHAMSHSVRPIELYQKWRRRRSRRKNKKKSLTFIDNSTEANDCSFSWQNFVEYTKIKVVSTLIFCQST